MPLLKFAPLAAMAVSVLIPFPAQPSDKELIQHEIPAADMARIKARIVCSCLFVQEMSPAQCLDGKDEIYRYLSPGPLPVPQGGQERLDVSVDPAGATVSLLHAEQVVAVSRYVPDGGGCLTGQPGRKFPGFAKPPQPSGDAFESLPRADLPANANRGAISDALGQAFVPRGALPGYGRAVMVVHDGKVVIERYAPTFGAHHRYYLGSVAKVFNNLLAGALVREGKLDVGERVLLPQWRKPKDPRAGITFDQLLRMASGLQWDEEFFQPGAPGYEVFFAGASSVDTASYVAAQPLEAVPGTHYEYSTGSSMLLAHALQSRIPKESGDVRSETLRFLRRTVLEPIGALGVIPEFDMAGTLLTGESIYARTEDLARIGLLFLQDGRWQGKPVLPAGWMEYSTSLALAKSREEPYGAQLELDYVVPGCFGHTGVGAQKLIVCPDRRLVVVWLGSDFDFFSWGNYATLSKGYGRLKDVQAQLVRAFPVAQ